MSRVFTFLLGKGKEELESMLRSIEEKLAKNPEDAYLKEDKMAIEKALKECEN